MVLDFAKTKHFTTLAIVTMHYWRLLLLALLAISQPIASFTERNLVNGQHQCYDRPSLLRDSRLSLNGFGRMLFEDRRLNNRGARELNRENRQNEVRGDDSVRISAERRIVDSRAREEVRPIPEESSRFSRIQYQRTRYNQRLVDSARFLALPEDRSYRYNQVSSRDSNKRELEDHQVRSLWDLRNVRQVRDVRRSIDVRDERRFNNAKSGIPITVRREVRRIRDVGDSRDKSESRENGIVSQRTRDEVARNDALMKRELSELQERRSYRTERDIRTSERRPMSQRNPGNVRNVRQSSRIQSQEDIRTVNRDEKRRTDLERAIDRHDTRGFDSSERNFAGHDLQTERSVASRDIYSRQSHSLERKMDNRQESRRRKSRESLYNNRDEKNIETSTRLHERESRIRNLDKKSVRTERSIQRELLRHEQNNARTFDRTETRSISESAVSRNENANRELRRMRQVSGERKSMRTRNSSRDTERKESLANERLDRNGYNIPESNHRSVSVDTRRVKSRLTNEMVHKRAGMERRNLRSLDHFKNNVRTNLRHQANTNDLRVTDIRDTSFESRRDNSRYTIRREGTFEKRMFPDNRKDYDRSTSRNGEMLLVNIAKRRVNTRTIIRDNIKEAELREHRSNKRYNRNVTDRFAPSADNRVANLEIIRVGSISSPERRSNDRPAFIRDNREVMNRRSRVYKQTQRKRLETRTVKNLALERDNIALTRNRILLNLYKDNKLLDVTESFKLNWHYLLYTLQLIYVTGMLLKMFSSSEKNIRTQAFWIPTQKLLKVD